MTRNDVGEAGMGKLLHFQCRMHMWTRVDAVDALRSMLLAAIVAAAVLKLVIRKNSMYSFPTYVLILSTPMTPPSVSLACMRLVQLHYI